MDSWRDVEAGLDVLLSGADACMKGPRLQELCTALQQLIDREDSGNSSVLSCVQCFVKTLKLLAKLLILRKRARDWKQQDYSSRVALALAAATAVLEHPSLLVNPVAAGKMGKKLLADTQLLPLAAAAQQEVAQLLTVTAQQHQQHQGKALLPVAELLLLWWLAAQHLWSLCPYRQSFAKGTTAAAAQYYAFHLQAVELAAALVQTAGRDCTTGQFLAVTEVGGQVPSSVVPPFLRVLSCSAQRVGVYS
jgi:hypothetical protein